MKTNLLSSTPNINGLETKPEFIVANPKLKNEDKSNVYGDRAQAYSFVANLLSQKNGEEANAYCCQPQSPY